MSIPLVQNNEKDSINTSIIAIKRNIERINMLLGLSNSEEIDTSEFVKKSDIVDEVTVGNMQSVTSNAVAEYKTDTVAVNNMLPITSDAVARKINDLYIPIYKRNISNSIWGEIHTVALNIINSCPVGMSFNNIVNTAATYQTYTLIITKVNNSYFSYIGSGYYQGAIFYGRYNNGTWLSS